MSLPNLSAEIDAFLARSGMSPTRFGKDALGDPGFVFALREGRSPSIRTAEKVFKFIKSWQLAATEASAA